jgi:hypothetical protein
MPIMHHADDVFKMAIAACARTDSAPDDLTPNQPDALVTLILCAVALEAYIVELIDHIRLAEYPDMEQFIATANLMRGGAKLQRRRYQLAYPHYTGKPCDQTTYPYRELNAIFELRNKIAHLGPINSAVQDKVVPMAAQRKLCKPWIQHSSWFRHIATRALARWACRVAVDTEEWIINALETNQSRRGWLQRRFRPPP